MSLKDQIEAVFGAPAFVRPLFYRRPGGLRMELSEGGSAIEQFLTAMRKALEVCAEVFDEDETITVCLSVFVFQRAFAFRETVRELRAAGISLPRAHCMWMETEEPDAQLEDEEVTRKLHLVFEAPKRMLQNFLWCALARDFGTIQPNPGCVVYLLNLRKRLMILPYDDRGLDIVGPNHTLLGDLYEKYSRYLLDHDRETMAATFEPATRGN